MRTVIIIDNGEVQIDMIPENTSDKVALDLIPPGAVLRVGKASGYAPSWGGYFRPYDKEGAVKFTFATTLPDPDLADDKPEMVVPL